MRKLLPDNEYLFSHDVRGNVTSVSNSLSKIDFEYEHFDGGDVVSRVHSYGIGDGVDLPDESKQLIEEDYKYQYAFDLNGNMTSKIEKGFTGNVENFDYTSENQLKTFRLYDSIGRRIEKTVVNHKDNLKSYTKRFAYDGQEILFEMDGENTITKTYTHSTLRTDDVLSVAIENKSYFFLKDGLGTITDIADSNGFKVQHYEYSAFGKLHSITDGSGNDITLNPTIEPYFTYTGREYDEETGLYYYRARYYDSRLGRFLQVDPDAGRLSNPVTHINKYAYVGNSPVNMIDPSGKSFLSKLGIEILVGASGVVTADFIKRNWEHHREEIINTVVSKLECPNISHSSLSDPPFSKK